MQATQTGRLHANGKIPPGAGVSLRVVVGEAAATKGRTYPAYTTSCRFNSPLAMIVSWISFDPSPIIISGASR